MTKPPTMEFLLGLPEQPQLVDDESQVLAMKVYDGLERVSEAAQDPALQRAIQQVMSDFHELQLCRESRLDDHANWGDAWKSYAYASIPVTYRVRLRLQEANYR
jgi:hypothetical protein